jgi:hypothetical protein
MRDVLEVHERLFCEGNSDTRFGASQTKFWRETEMAGIAKQKIANVHVEALRSGAFLSGQTRIDESHIPDTWKETISMYIISLWCVDHEVGVQ